MGFNSGFKGLTTITLFYDETARDRNCSVPGRFRLIEVLEIEILRTPDPQACKIFPIKAGFNYAEVRFNP